MARSPTRSPSDLPRDPRPRRSRTVKEVRHRAPTASYPQSTVDAPSMDELRRMRADFYSGSPPERRRSVTERIVREEPRRSERLSRVRDTEVKRPRMSAREIDSSDRRQRRGKQREVEDEGSRVYVYRNRELEEEPLQRRQSRRPTAASSMASHQPDRPKESSSSWRGLPRRESQRRRSEDRDAEVVVVRTEKRSVRPVSRAENRGPLQRSSSLRKPSAVPTVPPPLTRSQSTNRRPRPLAYAPPPASSACERLERSSTNRRKSDNGSVFFGSIFGTPKPLKPEKQVQCLTCLSDMPISKTAKLSCGHWMCNTCLRRIFTMSVTDPQHMPPKCCTSDHIPLKHVDKLFDLKFKRTWNKKYQEYTTKNRIYCPARGCGDWIKPSHIFIDQSGGANGGRKYGKCARCRTKVCCTCNGRWHRSRECPKDEATQRFVEVAKKEGWQRCFNCSAMVELKEGCNHMTCRCRAEFCMICGLKWKTCDCPWFNYTPLPDHLPHAMYQEELARRHDQERRDEALARRLQMLNVEINTLPPPQTANTRTRTRALNIPPLPPNPVDVFLVGNTTNHHLNDDFVMNDNFGRRAPDILSGTYNDAVAEAARDARGRGGEVREVAGRIDGSRRVEERVVPRAEDRSVPTRRETERRDEVGRGAEREERTSTMAGLWGGSAEGRVRAWMRYVDGGGEGGGEP